MRLWHEELISLLPRQQLLGQHRECAALRGKGWGKSHSVINYIFKYDLNRLYAYHLLIMTEMIKRGYKVTKQWYNPNYRGKIIGYDYSYKYVIKTYTNNIYPEHNNDYLVECLENLKKKGIIL